MDKDLNIRPKTTTPRRKHKAVSSLTQVLKMIFLGYDTKSKDTNSKNKEVVLH